MSDAGGGPEVRENGRDGISRITVTCPTCGYLRAVDEAAVPDGPANVKCPRCPGIFVFKKGAGVLPAEAGGPAVPRVSEGRKQPAPKPGARRPAPTARGTGPPPPRSRRRVFLRLGAVALGVVLVAAAWMHIFKLTPVLAEKLLIAGLFSKVPPVQYVAIEALRRYPTKHVAVSLVLFINLKNLQEAPDSKKPETPEEKARRRAVRRRDLALAERATETLCLLTGQSFGTYFRVERYGHSWGSLSEDKWPTVLAQIDAWALRTFGAGALSLLPVGMPGTSSGVTEVPAGGEAR